MDMKIKEVIVVEGKNDTNKLQQVMDCDTIETQGTHLSKATLELLKEVNESRGIIIFTDPDAPGEKIRSCINQYVKNAKNAFIMKEKAKTTKKVGVEHASAKDIKEALAHVITFSEDYKETLSKEEFIQLGLNGQPYSAQLRKAVGDILFLGKCNAKQLLKRVNMLQINKESLERIIKDIHE